VLQERGHDLIVTVPALTMLALTVALDAPTVRHEPLGDVAASTRLLGEVSLEALCLRNLTADRGDHFNLSHFIGRWWLKVSLTDDQGDPHHLSRRQK
jgi:hypothetical protein